jgi:hypothetical protein
MAEGTFDPDAVRETVADFRELVPAFGGLIFERSGGDVDAFGMGLMGDMAQFLPTEMLDLCIAVFQAERASRD